MRRRENGVALIMALLVVAAAALFALTMAHRGRRLATDTILDRVAATARAAASGGIERARWALARDADYAGETLRIGTSDVEIRVVRTDEHAEILVLATTTAAPFADSVTERVDAALALRASGLPTITRWSE